MMRSSMLSTFKFTLLKLTLMTWILSGFGFQLPSSQAANSADDAKAAYMEAQKYFTAEEYELALPLFEKAYQLSQKKPSAILALAQCLRMVKKYERSISLFKEYLETKQGQSEAIRVKETLKILEIQLAKSTELQEKQDAEKQRKNEEQRRGEEERAKQLALELAVPPPPASAAANPDSSSQTWFWVSVGLIVIGASVGGVVLGMNASQDATLYEGSYGKVLTP